MYIEVQLPPHKIVAAIRDSGPGIEPENISKIFDRFFRAETGGTGVGLGLHIARTIAHIHRGSIEVESQKGDGTTFCVILPRA